MGILDDFLNGFFGGSGGNSGTVDTGITGKGSALDSFISAVRTKDFQRTERFRVVISPPPASGVDLNATKDVALMVEECNIPGLILQNRAVKYNNRTQYQPTALDFLGQEATFVFYLQSDWTQRNMIETWINYCVDPKTREVGYKDDIIGEIKIYPVNRKGEDAKNPNNQSIYYTLHRAFPRSISVMPMSQGTSGVARTTATFTFDSWSSDVIDGSKK